MTPVRPLRPKTVYPQEVRWYYEQLSHLAKARCSERLIHATSTGSGRSRSASTKSRRSSVTGQARRLHRQVKTLRCFKGALLRQSTFTKAHEPETLKLLKRRSLCSRHAAARRCFLDALLRFRWPRQE